MGCCSVVKVRKDVTCVEPTQETLGENLLIRLRLLYPARNIWLHNMLLRILFVKYKGCIKSRKSFSTVSINSDGETCSSSNIMMPCATV